MAKRKQGSLPPGVYPRRKFAFTTSERMMFNISGEIYETYHLTLLRYPDTLLGDPEKRNQFYCSKTNKYFFDRHRLCFEAILYFYQSFGILSCPVGVSLDLFESECRFFQVPDHIIEHMKKKEGIIPDLDTKLQLSHRNKHISRYQLYVWNVLENPETSTTGKIFAILSFSAIFISTLSASLKTVEYFSSIPWTRVEDIINYWFSIELFSRFIISPAKCTFIKSKLNWIDACAVVPFFIMSTAVGDQEQNSVAFLRMLRFIRVLRFFRLTNHSKRLKVVSEIIMSSLEDFQMLMSCLAILVILCASIMYYVESNYDPDTSFSSIPMSLWWAIVTITTVGYGDIVPSTLIGKIMSSGFMAFGALTISLPVMSIVTKFTTMYVKNIDSKRGKYSTDFS